MDEKVINKYKNSFITLGTIELIIIILGLVTKFSLVELLIACLLFVLFFVGFCFVDEKKKSAGYVGIFIGILLLISVVIKDYLSVLIGLDLIVNSIKYIKSFKKSYGE